MKSPNRVTARFQWMRNTSVGILCLYYYLSLLRDASGFLGVNIGQATGILLISFLLITFIQLLLNAHVVYSVFQRSRLSFLMILSSVFLFTVLTKQSWLMIPFLLFLSYADESFKVLSKKLFIYSSICFISVVSLGIYLPGLGREVIDKSYSVASLFGTNANSLGFPNSNQPLLYFLVISINGAFLFTSTKHRRLYALTMFMIATGLFAVTLSVTGYICVSVFLMLYSFATDRYLKIAPVIIPAIVFSAILFTPLVASRYGYDNRIATNQMLANRPYLWNLRVSDGAYKNFIGNADNFQSKSAEDKNGYTLDNQYLLLIARYGWVALLVFIYIYFIGIREITSLAIASGLLSLSIYFVFESVMFILVLCILPVIMINAKTIKTNSAN